MISAQLQAALLVEADPAQDREFRQKAEAFYNRLIGWLKSHRDMKEYRIREYILRQNDEESKVYAYEVNVKDLGVAKEYPNLAVVLAPFRTGTAAFGKHQKFRVIKMPVMTPDVLKMENGEEMARNLGWVREVFIHEFIHYLDDLRYKGKPQMDSAALKQKGGEKAYFNSAVEFNAYFQGGASDIEKHAAKLEPGQFARKYGRPGTGFKKFRKDFEHLINNTFRKALADQWKRKYEVRLWQLHQDLLARDRGLE